MAQTKATKAMSGIIAFEDTASVTLSQFAQWMANHSSASPTQNTHGFAMAYEYSSGDFHQTGAVTVTVDSSSYAINDITDVTPFLSVKNSSYQADPGTVDEPIVWLDTPLENAYFKGQLITLVRSFDGMKYVYVWLDMPDLAVAIRVSGPQDSD